MNRLRIEKGLSIWFGSVSRQDWWAMLLYLWSFSILLFAFPYTAPRFVEACCDFGLELARFVAEFINIAFGADLTLPCSGLLVRSAYVGSIDLAIFDCEWWMSFWAAFSNPEVFHAWLHSLYPSLVNGMYLLTFLVPFIVCIVLLVKKQYTTFQGEVKDSRPYIMASVFKQTLIDPAKTIVQDFVYFLCQNRVYIYVYVVVVLFSFNVFSIIIEAVAWYFYILSTFDFVHLYIAIYKLFVDILPVVFWIPTLLYVYAGVKVLDSVRKKRAYNVLEHHEAMDKGFIASLPLVNFIWGTMGSKKTTLLSDMALSYSAYFRFHAYELLLECDLLYPDFPWISLERDLCARMDLPIGDPRRVFNLLSAEEFIEDIYTSFLCGEFDLWGYDGPFESCDGLTENDLYSVLSDYVRLYFIYVVHSSLLISNYGLREDCEQLDLGNFPRWSFDYFRKDPRYSAACSRHSHVIDFDLLRLGKQLIRGNPDNNGFEFGIICITEIGKERGNQNDNKRFKAEDHETNPLNDDFNVMLKLIRHFATVRYFPFVVVLVDDQRPESWAADARDLCQLIRVDSCTETHCAEHLRFVDDYIHDVVFSRFCRRYETNRYYRADNQLLMVLYKRFVSWMHKKYIVSHNTFDYFVADLVLENGTQKGGETHHPYYLSKKKVYANRFATDAFAGFTKARVSRSCLGLDDIPVYATTMASVDELKSTNSYLINKLTESLLRERKKGCYR